MDCKQSEIAMMQHMENTITPQTAKDLAKHVLSCKNCREYYIAFDEAMEFSLDENFAMVEAPTDLTKNIMNAIKKDPLYTQSGQKLLHVLWGFSAILMGIGIYLVFNPMLLAELAGYPIVSAINNTLTNLGQGFANALQPLVMDATLNNSLGIAALFFACMLGGLLTVLYQGERSINT